MSNFLNHKVTIYPSKLSGSLHIPPSKSHSQRALIFALLARGTSEIENLLDSPDITAMQKAIKTLGAHVELPQIKGELNPTKEVIDAQNSGQVLRFCAAIGALSHHPVKITGDDSCLTKRPMTPLLDALEQLGAKCRFSHPFFEIQGPIQPGFCQLDGKDSQPVSALLMATAQLKGKTTIVVTNPGELPWIDLTLFWLKKFGAKITHTNYQRYKVEGPIHIDPFAYTVPADYSSAAFPIAAALITQSSITFKGLDLEDVQGDKQLLSTLEKMGARFQWHQNTLTVFPSKLKGIEIDVNHCIDALPILSLIGCFAEGKTTLYNGTIARYKESDRISAIAQELKKMGAKIQELPDGLIIEQSPLAGSDVSAHDDHRIALTLAVAALGADGATTIEGWEWTRKSYPTFLEDLKSIGARCELDTCRV